LTRPDLLNKSEVARWDVATALVASATGRPRAFGNPVSFFETVNEQPPLENNTATMTMT
jgi:hypothetical protein